MVTVRNQGQAIICRLEFTHPIRWGGNRTQIRTEGRIRPPAARHISSQSYYWRNSKARRELRAHLGLLGRHRWQCRSSSIGFLGVDFAPPHVKNGRLAFPPSRPLSLPCIDSPSCSIVRTILALRMAPCIRSPNENGPEAFTPFGFYQIEKPF